MFTDKQGEFTAKQLKAGKYKVEPELPPNYTSRKKFEEVMIDDRGSVMVRFETYIDGRVMGRVVDNEGNNFDFIRLSLVGEGKKMTGSSTGEDGVFEIQGVPPGEYFLTLQMQNPGDQPKIKSYYYPGTFDREKAATIRVGLGARVADLEFRLPAESLVRTVEGEVVWDDGAPAANVNVHLLCPQNPTPNGLIIEFNPTSTRTDKEGRFRLEGFTSETYWIQARGLKANENTAKNSPSLKLSINQNVKNLKLKLSKAGGFGDCR